MTPPQVKTGLSALFFAFMFVSNFSIAQNPTVISDSLVVMNRVYAKEKLIVDKLAVFKEDIKVQGSARVQTDLRIDGDLRVDGTARLNGNVKMPNISLLPNFVDSAQLVVRMPNGQLKTVELKDLIIGIYTKECVPVDVPNPIWNNGLNKLFVTYCGKVNVGIGTDNPEYLLDVRDLVFLDRIKTGSRQAIDDAMINGFDVTNSRDLIQLGLDNALIGNISDVRFKVTHDGAIFAKNLSNQTSFELHSGTGHAIVVYGSTGSKILQMEDNGLLRTREIRIDAAAWADYVFDKNYQLPKLKDVAKFINKNHHLPGIPSSKEIKENGINVGEMQTLQMQKIEELTLYLIEMDEKMSAMQTEIDDLKEENKKLKK